MHRFLEATAGQYMTHQVKTVTRDTTMRELHKMFEADDFNCYPVREGDDIVGVVSNFDFLKCFAFNPGRMVPAYDDLLSRMVADVMTPEFIYVDPATKLTRVLQLMVDHRMKSLPVLDAEQRLAALGAKAVMLDSAQSAIGFYENHGYTTQPALKKRLFGPDYRNPLGKNLSARLQ